MAEGRVRLQDWAPTLALVIVAAGVTGVIFGKFGQQWVPWRPLRTGLEFAIVFTVSKILISRRRKALRRRGTR